MNGEIDREAPPPVRCTDIESTRQADAQYITGLRPSAFTATGEATCEYCLGEGEA